MVIAECQVDYAGRLSAHLPMAKRLIIGVDGDRAIRLHNDQPLGHRQMGRQPSRIVHLTFRNHQTHRPNLAKVSRQASQLRFAPKKVAHIRCEEWVLRRMFG